MSFDAHDRALDLLRTLSPLLAPLTACDASLADQLRRAAASTLLNIAEANRVVFTGGALLVVPRKIARFGAWFRWQTKPQNVSAARLICGTSR